MPDTPVEAWPGDPYHSAPEFRVSRLESDVHDLKASMGRLEVMVAEIKALLTAYACGLAALAILK